MSARLSPAQAAALRYVRAVNATGIPVPTTPRADVLARLAVAGLITREVRTHRPRTCDRWQFDARHALTDTGRAALAELDAEDENPAAYRYALRSAAARRAVRRAR